MVVEDLNEKINKTTTKSKISQLKRTRNKPLKRYKELGETFIEINVKKTEALDRLLELDCKLGSGEIKKSEDVIRERNKLIKRYRDLG